MKDLLGYLRWRLVGGVIGALVAGVTLVAIAAEGEALIVSSGVVLGIGFAIGFVLGPRLLVWLIGY